MQPFGKTSRRRCVAGGARGHRRWGDFPFFLRLCAAGGCRRSCRACPYCGSTIAFLPCISCTHMVPARAVPHLLRALLSHCLSSCCGLASCAPWLAVRVLARGSLTPPDPPLIPMHDSNCRICCTYRRWCVNHTVFPPRAVIQTCSLLALSCRTSPPPSSPSWRRCTSESTFHPTALPLHRTVLQRWTCPMWSLLRLHFLPFSHGCCLV